MKIAYVCYTIQKKYTSETVKDEDILLIEFFKNKGLNIHREVWTNTSVDWADYDLVLFKSPWDYHEDIIKFYNWLEHLNQLNIKTINPYEIIKWNSDKHYLKDIADSGLAIIPTLFVEKNTSLRAASVFNQLNSEKIIIKPCIGAGSKNTFILTPENITSHQIAIDEFLKKEAFLIQPYIQEIESEGEWSLIFFDGKFSHSVLKKPRSGDFRVQHTHGGSIHPIKMNDKHLYAAEKYIRQHAERCLYSRVDGVIVNNTFLLMELELIEPFLFLSYDPMAFINYYNALVKLIDKIEKKEY